MQFKVVERCFQDAKKICDDRTVDFFLEEDNWNDYYYHTLYHLHAGSKVTHKEVEYLGSIKIMKKGQRQSSSQILRTNIGVDFERLPDDYCSMSMAVDLYRGLDRYLKTPDRKKEFVEALGLILSVEDEKYKVFKDDDCFNTSLLRYATMDAYSLKVGREILLDETTGYDLASQPLQYTLPGTETTVSFHFGSEFKDLANEADVPSRLLACIGNNGVGKSTILYRLARILFATPTARQHFSDKLGRIEPKDAGFRRLFIISYSAFDNFELPGVEREDYELILNGLQDKSGRLVYCGIRDIETEYKEKINDILNQAARPGTEEEADDPALHPNNKDKDHSLHHTLKTIDNLGVEFSVAYDSIRNDEKKVELWDKLIEECTKANDTLSEFFLKDSKWWLTDKEETVKNFTSLSTGIKYLLHSLSIILDRIEPNSIIIFDEPENHIQPPLLSKFLYCLRIIADRYASLILVATHSPVILQETLSRNVLIVSRHGDEWNFRQPSIETYGENIGSITNEVFNLNTSVTNYQNTAETLFKLCPPRPEEIEEPLSYLERVGLEAGISFGNEIQSYLLSRLLEIKN